MITNFGEIGLSNYRPEFRGLGVDEFYHSMDKLEHRYDQNLMATEQLREHVESLNVEDRNKDILHSAANNLYGTLTNLVEGGNLEYAERDLLKAARNFKNAPLLKESIEDYMQFQAWNADIRERGIDLDDPERFRQWQQVYANTARTLDYDEEGNVINRFNLPRPVDTPDIPNILEEFLNNWKGNKYFGVSMTGDPNDPQLVKQDNLGDYIRFGSTKIAAPNELYAAARTVLMNNPKVKAYVDELYMLDRSLNNADILTRLNNVGLDDTSLTLNLIDRNIISEGEHLERIQTTRSKLNAQVDIINNPKTSTKNREAAIKEYDLLNKELDAGVKAKLAGIVLDEQSYIQQLEAMYYDGFISNKLHANIKAYSDKHGYIEEDSIIKENWRRREDYKHNLARKRLLEENQSSLGESGVISFGEMDIRKGLEDYRNYNNTIRELDAVLSTLDPNIDEVEYNTRLAEKERIESLKRNYLTMANDQFQNLVNINPELQTKLDNSYKNYLRDHREYQRFHPEGGERVIGKPLSREEFILEAMTDRSSRPTNTAVSNTMFLKDSIRTGDINEISKQLAINSIRGNRLDLTGSGLPGAIGGGLSIISLGRKQVMGEEPLPWEEGAMRGNNLEAYHMATSRSRREGLSFETLLDIANKQYEKQGLQSAPIPHWYATGENAYGRVVHLNNIGARLTVEGKMLDGSGISIYESLANRFNKSKDINFSASGLSTTRTADYTPDQLSKLFEVDARIIRTVMPGGIGFSVQFVKDNKALVDREGNPISIEVYPQGNNEQEVIQLVRNAIFDPLYNPQTAYEYQTNPIHASTLRGAKDMQFVIGLGRELSKNNINVQTLKTHRSNVSFISDSGLRWDLQFTERGEIELIPYDRSGKRATITTQDNSTGKWLHSDWGDAAIFYENVNRAQVEAAYRTQM